MKSIFFAATLLLAFSLSAQAPVAVPIPQEPHHHLVLENDYVRVFRVSVPAHESTLLHQHDVPYLYVALGPADVINAVQGKPEVHLVMADGQLGYSPGHFAHIARNDSDLPFNNVTIELLKPQGKPQNICAQVAPGAEEAPCSKLNTQKRNGVAYVPQFETDVTSALLAQLDPIAQQTTITPYSGTVFVLLSGTGIQTVVKGNPVDNLAVGDVMWLLAGSNTTFSNPSHKAWSYLTLAFKGSESRYKY